MSIEDPNEVPEVWRPHFAAQRIEFTFRDLDRNVPGVALNTIRRALLGIGTPSRRVASAIAGALGISEEEFNATRAKVTGDTPTAPFTLPTSADLLNQRERDAVLSVVHALLDARDRHAEPAATPADPPPATPPRAPSPKDEKTRAGDKPADLNPENQGGRLVSFPTRDDALPEGIAANLGDKGVPDDESAPGEAIEPIPDDDDLP